MEDQTSVYVVSGADLWRSVMAVERSAAKDYSRPVLAGILMEVEPHAITFAAADGFRLSVSSLDRKGHNLVPNKVLFRKEPFVAFVKRAKKADEIHITLRGDAWTLVNVQDAESVTMPVIDGTFPDWRQIMPRDEDRTVVVSLNPKYVADAGAVSSVAPVLQFARSAEPLPNEPVLLLSKDGGDRGQVIARHLIMPMVFGDR